jgi:DNA-binding NarL/FixJ family response regulator
MHLTDREREVLDLIKEGSPNKLIARLLGISECTVKIHVRNVLWKTHSRNRTQAAMSTEVME